MKPMQFAELCNEPEEGDWVNWPETLDEIYQTEDDDAARSLNIPDRNCNDAVSCEFPDHLRGAVVSDRLGEIEKLIAARDYYLLLGRIELALRTEGQIRGLKSRTEKRDAVGTN